MTLSAKPQIWRFDNANALYYALVDTLTTSTNQIIAEGKRPVLALPTGNTMVPFYRIATEAQNQKDTKLNVSQWQCFNLDEYYPITEANQPYTFDSFMDQHFYSHLNEPVAFRKILNGRARDPLQECNRYEELIQERGGIDIAILGIGTNGHIAFNEPGSEFDSRTRLVELHPQTLMANFQGQALFTHAMTMGIGTLLSAKQIFVVALGKNKANAVKAAIQDVESRMCPASGLRRHSNVTWFLDQDASQLI
jgi:glucosamine-6-phosphate deaminase